MKSGIHQQSHFFIVDIIFSKIYFSSVFVWISIGSLFKICHRPSRFLSWPRTDSTIKKRHNCVSGLMLSSIRWKLFCHGWPHRHYLHHTDRQALTMENPWRLLWSNRKMRGSYFARNAADVEEHTHPSAHRLTLCEAGPWFFLLFYLLLSPFFFVNVILFYFKILWKLS